MFTGSIYSKSLGMTTGLTVIFPDESNDVTPLFTGKPKLLYLLHGLSGSSAEWVRFSKIEYYAKKFHFVIVMPEVNRSFYCNTVTGMNYYTYVSKELPEIVGKWFRVDTSPENSYIAGESMGGYGAMKLALRNPQSYAGAAALSGVLDFAAFCRRIQNREWPDYAFCELQQILGQSGMPEIDDDPIALLKNFSGDLPHPKLMVLCGTEDFLYADNVRFHKEAEALGIAHTYREAPGDHEWPYWDKAIQYVFHFFCGMDSDSVPLY